LELDVILEPGWYEETLVDEKRQFSELLGLLDCEVADGAADVFGEHWGFNDLFKPVIKGLEEMNLIIFNRYGNQVASWKEGSVNWDGNHSGAASPDGVYFYVLMGKDYSGTEVERTGSLTIMR
jgi:gliding motility-associated-like protein